MIDDVAIKEKVLAIFKKRDQASYDKCVGSKCSMFDIEEVGPGLMMYFCMEHNYNGNVVI